MSCISSPGPIPPAEPGRPAIGRPTIGGCPAPEAQGRKAQLSSIYWKRGAFRDEIGAFTRKNTVLLGVNRNSVKAQKTFKDKYILPFRLLSDPDGKVCAAYGVIKEKTMYGRKVKGIERSTFIIDGTGRVKKAFRGVKVEGQASAVLTCV